MSTDLASDFSDLKRPASLFAAARRLLLFGLLAVALLFIVPDSWTGWQAGLMMGLVAGALWAFSWRWKSSENRVVVWLVIYLGGMILCGILYRGLPSWGALVCMYLGFELVLLGLHSRLRAWAAPTLQQNQGEQGVPPQSATHAESRSGRDHPKSESEERPR